MDHRPSVVWSCPDAAAWQQEATFFWGDFWTNTIDGCLILIDSPETLPLINGN